MIERVLQHTVEEHVQVVGFARRAVFEVGFTEGESGAAQFTVRPFEGGDRFVPRGGTGAGGSAASASVGSTTSPATRRRPISAHTVMWITNSQIVSALGIGRAAATSAETSASRARTGGPCQASPSTPR